MEKIKVIIWTILHLPKFRFRYWQTREKRKKLQIFTSVETIDYILRTECSVSRFGDGELQMISHFLKKGKKDSFGVDTFQSYDPMLAQRLVEVFQSSLASLLICLPYQFKKSNINKIKARVFWEREWLGRNKDLQHLGLVKQFGDTNFTRFYMHRIDILDYPDYLSKMKMIWKNRPILIVEGEFSRLGIGNDFFDGVASIERIICPATDAFGSYIKILSAVQKTKKDKLILIALGHTATVLAYDLGQKGYQAIDLGHVDIEYEWYTMGVKQKIAIPNKYVNEVASGRIDTSYMDRVYQQQIIDRIR